MSVAASAIISRVRTQLVDTGLSGPLRWSDAELLQWISDGQRQIVSASPRAAFIRAVIPLVAGTLQAIPAGGYTFITAYRNMGVSGVTPGAALETVDRTLMDTQYPAWHSATPVAAPSVLMFDPTDPTAFWVYPPSDGTGHLQIGYAGEPADLVNTTDLLVVQDIYATPLFDYAMMRATQKDSDYVGGQAVAAAYLSGFTLFVQNVMKDALTLNTMSQSAQSAAPAPQQPRTR